MTAGATTLLVGGYGSRAGGRADGIRVVTLDRSGLLTGGETVLRTESPSFVRTHPWLPVVYAVNEADGRFGAHRVAGRGLEEVATWDVGPSPCHIAVDPRGRGVVVSCWGDGAVVFLPLDASGLPGEPQPGARGRGRGRAGAHHRRRAGPGARVGAHGGRTHPVE